VTYFGCRVNYVKPLIQLCLQSLFFYFDLGAEAAARQPPSPSVPACMLCIYSFEVSLFFNIIPENLYAFVPPWHEFKHSITLETRLLHSQQFTNNNAHFPITVELAASLLLPQKPKQQYIMTCDPSARQFKPKQCTANSGVISFS
jgi:hypothetical protein